MTGFSPRNLKYMRTFSGSWPDREFVQRTIAHIPWRSNGALLDKLKDADLRVWYAQKTFEHGWSREILNVARINAHQSERDAISVIYRSLQKDRDAVLLTIRDFLWSDTTGLPVDHYTEDDVQARVDEVYRHVYRVCPALPSPFYEKPAAA